MTFDAGIFALLEGKKNIKFMLLFDYANEQPLFALSLFFFDTQINTCRKNITTENHLTGHKFALNLVHQMAMTITMLRTNSKCYQRLKKYFG